MSEIETDRGVCDGGGGPKLSGPETCRAQYPEKNNHRHEKKKGSVMLWFQQLYILQ